MDHSTRVNARHYTLRGLETGRSLGLTGCLSSKVQEVAWCPLPSGLRAQWCIHLYTLVHMLHTHKCFHKSWEGNSGWWLASIIPVLGKVRWRTAPNTKPVWTRARPYQITQGVSRRTRPRASVPLGRKDGGKRSRLDQIKGWIVGIISVSSELWCWSLVDLWLFSGAIQSLCEIA